jgi:thiol-disulfide isomerase/thioredoxin
MELTTRLFAAVVLILISVALYHGANWLILFRNRQHSGQLEYFNPGTPAILFFTMPGCVPCKTFQHPAILRVKNSLGSQLQVIEINVEEQPDLAEKWGVLSVPTTFILNSQGKPCHVNHGATTAEKLIEQLSLVN